MFSKFMSVNSPTEALKMNYKTKYKPLPKTTNPIIENTKVPNVLYGMVLECLVLQPLDKHLS